MANKPLDKQTAGLVNYPVLERHPKGLKLRLWRKRELQGRPSNCTIKRDIKDITALPSVPHNDVRFFESWKVNQRGLVPRGALP